MNTYLDFNDAPEQSNVIDKITLDDLRDQLLSRLPEVLSYLFPVGKIRGNQFYIGNIRGDKGDSLVFTLEGDKAGLWHDFATGEGGDVIAAWAYYHHLDIKTRFPEIIDGIANWLGVVPAKSYASPIVKRQVLDDLGPHTAKWDYLDANGQLIACVYRYDTVTGKQFRPWDAIARKMQAPNPRPLYNQPGMRDESTIVLVEGEKCADALINVGICATTAMMGANAPIEKTDWSPLEGKHVIIWPDNDEAGKTYAQRVAIKLETQSTSSIAVLNLPENKPAKWDAADAIADGLDVRAFITTCSKTESMIQLAVPAFTVGHFLDDTSPMPEDLILPRVLTPGGLMVFGGAPKVGKSDFLLSMLAHMAAGVSFLGMKPPRPLRIFYLQAEIGYHYLRERLQSMAFDNNLLPLVSKNLVITPQFKMLLNEHGVAATCEAIRSHFAHLSVDIIVVDPLRNVFDGGEGDAGENDNAAMLFFLQQRLDALRDAVNPDAGIILVHHTRKIQKKQLEEDPFQALSGAGSLRGYYTTGLIIFQPDENQSCRQLIFELRNGPRLPSKVIDKIDGAWQEMENRSDRLVNRDYGQKLDAERRRKRDVILEILYEEARAGHVYTSTQFAEHFENKAGLGGRSTIIERISVLATKGYIKYVRNPDEYQLPPLSRTRYGYLCVEDMQFGAAQETVDTQTGEATETVICLLPSHYKCRQSGALLEVENPKIWVYNDEEYAHE